MYKNSHNYPLVQLKFNDTTKNKFVQKLVAIYFVNNPDPNNRTVVHHMNENTKDYSWENLEWVTSQFNTEYSVGTKVKIMDKERKIAARFHSIKKCAEKFDFGRGKHFNASYLSVVLKKNKVLHGYTIELQDHEKNTINYEQDDLTMNDQEDNNIDD